MESILMNLYIKYLHHSEGEGDIDYYLKENNPTYPTINDELIELEESITKKLDEETRGIFDEIIYHRTNLEELKISFAFSQGFILAMKIALEIATTKITIEK